MADKNKKTPESVLQDLKKRKIDEQVNLEKLNSPETAFKTAGAFLEGTETFLRLLMLPLFILGFALWPLGAVGYIFMGLAIFNFFAAKISGASFKDEFKDASDLLKGNESQKKLLNEYKQSLEKVQVLEEKLDNARKGIFEQEQPTKNNQNSGKEKSQEM